MVRVSHLIPVFNLLCVLSQQVGMLKLTKKLNIKYF